MSASSQALTRKNSGNLAAPTSATTSGPVASFLSHARVRKSDDGGHKMDDYDDSDPFAVRRIRRQRCSSNASTASVETAQPSDEQLKWPPSQFLKPRYRLTRSASLGDLRADSTLQRASSTMNVGLETPVAGVLTRTHSYLRSNHSAPAQDDDGSPVEINDVSTSSLRQLPYKPSQTSDELFELISEMLETSTYSHLRPGVTRSAGAPTEPIGPIVSYVDRTAVADRVVGKPQGKSACGRYQLSVVTYKDWNVVWESDNADYCILPADLWLCAPAPPAGSFGGHSVPVCSYEITAYTAPLDGSELNRASPEYEIRSHEGLRLLALLDPMETAIKDWGVKWINTERKWTYNRTGDASTGIWVLPFQVPIPVRLFARPESRAFHIQAHVRFHANVPDLFSEVTEVGVEYLKEDELLRGRPRTLARRN